MKVENSTKSQTNNECYHETPSIPLDINGLNSLTKCKRLDKNPSITFL